MTILKGTECYPSERGYYNFYYPNFDKGYKLTMNVEVKELPWVGSEGYKAFEVISPADYLPIKVLWIKEIKDA